MVTSQRGEILSVCAEFRRKNAVVVRPCPVIGVTVTAGVLPAAWSPVMSAKYAASDGNGATRRGGPAAVGRGAPEDGGPGLVQTTAVF